MDTAEFDLMDSLDKIELLADKGVMLAIRDEGCFQICLFQLGAFYVEIYLHLGQSCVKLVRSFDKTSELNIYLDEIDISDLMNSVQFNN